MPIIERRRSRRELDNKTNNFKLWRYRYNVSGVFIAAIVIYFKPDWAIVDPICTFVFSLLVLGTTVTILRNTLAVIMEAAPPGTSYSSVRNTLLTVPGIQAVHNLRYSRKQNTFLKLKC